MSSEIKDWISKSEEELIAEAFNESSRWRKLVGVRNTGQNKVVVTEYKQITLRRRMLLNAFIDREKSNRKKCQ